MAGVVLGPSGLFFVGDAAEMQDMSHLANLRLQDHTPKMTENSKILTVLCESEKEKIEAWRANMAAPEEERIRSPRTAELTSATPFPSESAPLRQQCFTSVTSRLSPDVVQETQQIFSPPRQVQMRCRGLTFIADVENHCIQVLRADGRHVRRFGTFGKEFGQFNALQSLVVDDEEMLIYVTDTYNHRIQVLETRLADASDMKVIRVIGAFGQDDGFFNYPVGLTLLRSTDQSEINKIIVADTCNDRIQILSTAGKHISSFGRMGKHETNDAGVPLFKLPHDICVIAEKIYVSDYGNHRIQVLTIDGKHVRSLGSHGTKTGMFVNPRRLMRGPSGILLVTDQVRTVYKFGKVLQKGRRMQTLSFGRGRDIVCR
jgi:hypothetical protein